MGQERLVVVFASVARKLVNCDIAESDFIIFHFVLVAVELLFAHDICLAEFFDDLLNIEFKETFVRVDLLGNETILFEVAVNDGPRVVLVYLVHVGAEWHLLMRLHN